MKTIKESLQLLDPIIKENIWILLLAFIMLELTQHHFINMIEMAKLAQNDVTKIIATLGQSLTALTEYVFMAMLVPLRVMEIEQNRPKQTFAQFTQKHIMPLTAEGLRSLGVILLWTLLLIIPGVFKYLRLSFVPYIVVADPEYDKGQRDALKYSNDLVKGFTGWLLLILIGLFVVEMLREMLRTANPLLQSPIIAIVGGALFFIFSLFANILLFKVYQLRVKKHEAKA